MTHALIIDDNMIISRAIRTRLFSLGFDSFDHVWTEEAALAATERKIPAMIVVGDAIGQGSGVQVARKIAEQTGAPVLMVSGSPWRARQHLAQASSFKGPFLLNEIEEAVALAID